MENVPWRVSHPGQASVQPEPQPRLTFPVAFFHPRASSKVPRPELSASCSTTRSFLASSVLETLHLRSILVLRLLSSYDFLKSVPVIQNTNSCPCYSVCLIYKPSLPMDNSNLDPWCSRVWVHHFLRVNFAMCHNFQFQPFQTYSFKLGNI